MARWRPIHLIILLWFVVSLIFIARRYIAPFRGSFDLPGLRHVPVEGHDESVLREASIEHASNSTLGFHAIYYINMKARYDRSDAASLQAYIFGLNLHAYPGVEPDMTGTVGMPPTHRPSALKIGEKGSWRAHVNVWAEMVRNKLPPVLIMESDATWDINVRPIMGNLNKHFVEFLRHINSTPVHDPSWGGKENHHHPHTASPPPPTPPLPIPYTPTDPWLNTHWDPLSLGHCYEHPPQDKKEPHLIYPDPSVPLGNSYFGLPLGHERVIRRWGGITCTTAYALSHTGAAKLLLCSAVDLDNPADLLIRRLTLSGGLVAYSVSPPVVAQWVYRRGVGMGGAQSDVHGAGGDGEQQDMPGDVGMLGWEEVGRTGTVWGYYYENVTFDKMALGVVWREIMGGAVLADSWYDTESGN
ncbi:hypothetical protein C8A01DRAFT_14683 [Parachaetomium inaequale]|uniref:Uncharacterized protein n=1 Tax=Parachaetomium inaequale TaxID=2588326 RepID=A0AAN6ST49_9PEZI|nr:hypothetical protein C8A01DRAFT_14683 [Parachaetomium inaequale]